MVAIGGHHATYMDKQILRESAIVKRRTTGDAEKFYDGFYKPTYIFRQMTGGKFYDHILARIALNHIIWCM
jgi:hypothetical protein